MDILIEALHGLPLYLLIFQVLVIAFLCFCLIALIVQRLREKLEGVDHAVETPLETEAHEHPFVLEQVQEELRAKVAALEEENKRLRTLPEERNELYEKVRHLESKLGEYEIVQEEIGTISDLKSENERLKKELASRP